MAVTKLRLLLSHPVRPPRLPGVRRLYSSSVAAAGPRHAPGLSKRGPAAATRSALLRVKRRTRSVSEFDREAYTNNLAEQRELHGYMGSGQEDGAGGEAAHVPVMLGEVLEVFSQPRIRSFVDCTVGAAGHSSALIRAHPELRLYVGLDLDPTALEMARTRIDAAIEDTPCVSASGAEERRRPRAHLLHANFKSLRSILGGIDGGILLAGGGGSSGVDGTIDGILMDLGMSSMQVNDPKRGFSVLGNGPLDMRMNPQVH